jgi:4-hydroxybenzoate polyprenyltransferase
MVMLAWAEGILASWFDYENDIHDGHRSFTTTFGRKNTRHLLITLHIAIFILLKINLLFTVNLFQFFAIIIEVLMNTALLLMLMLPKSMKINDRYRIFGEMVFWLPGLILLAG